MLIECQFQQKSIYFSLVTIYNYNEVMKMAELNIIYQANKKSGVVYAYEDRPYWDTEKKQSRSSRKLVGKVDPLTGNIVPTRGRKAKEPPVQAPEEPAHLIDAVPIIEKVIVFLRLFVCETLAKRVVSMVLVVVGLPESRVAELVGLSVKSVSTLKKRFETGEADDMFHVAGGGRKRKLTDLEGLIVEEINNNNYHSHQQIADMIQERYGIKVSLPVIGRLLKKTGSSG
jgi:transposase